MRRFSLTAGVLLLPALGLLVAAPGCGKKEEPKKPTPVSVEQKDTPGEGKKEAGKGGPIKGGDGVIKGKVVYDGDPPKADKLVAAVDHKDCKMAPEGEKVYQDWIIGKDKGVANVVVYLKAPAGGKFEGGEKPSGAVTVDQPHCAFVPRVAVVQSGQKFIIKNSAAFTHNTRVSGNPTKNPDQNHTLAPNSQKEVEFQAQSQPLSLNCDVHKWMSGKVWVFDHPYAAVTKADGTFEIKGVPTGVELTVQVWHEAKGEFHTQKMTPTSGENKLEVKVSAK